MIVEIKIKNKIVKSIQKKVQRKLDELKEIMSKKNSDKITFFIQIGFHKYYYMLIWTSKEYIII